MVAADYEGGLHKLCSQRTQLRLSSTRALPSRVASRTPLYEWHRAAGARFIEFGGWEMPLQYSGIVDEHLTVRQAVGLFAFTHMCKIFFEDPSARAVGCPPAGGSTGNRGVGEVGSSGHGHPGRTGPLRCQWTGLVSRDTNRVHRRGGIRTFSDIGRGIVGLGVAPEVRGGPRDQA